MAHLQRSGFPAWIPGRVHPHRRLLPTLRRDSHLHALGLVRGGVGLLHSSWAALAHLQPVRRRAESRQTAGRVALDLYVERIASPQSVVVGSRSRAAPCKHSAEDAPFLTGASWPSPERSGRSSLATCACDYVSTLHPRSARASIPASGASLQVPQTGAGGGGSALALKHPQLNSCGHAAPRPAAEALGAPPHSPPF